MHRIPLRVVLAASLVAAGSARVFAQGLPISLKVDPECETAAADFEVRVRAALLGAPAADRAARVVIDRRGARHRASVRVDADAGAGTQRILAASCDDAVAAAVAVLAQALSTPHAPPAAHGGTAEAGGRSTGAHGCSSEAEGCGAEGRAGERASGAGAGDVPRQHAQGRGDDEPAEGEPPAEASAPSVRVALRAGIDAGTLRLATGYLGLAATLQAGPVEWRAVVGYGLPYVDARVDPGIDRLAREQFFAVELGGCYGSGPGFRFAGCAGGELSAIHRAGVTHGIANERAAARLAGVLSAQLAYRSSSLQPEFELAAVVPVLGPTATPVAFRASLGLGLQF